MRWRTLKIWENKTTYHRPRQMRLLLSGLCLASALLLLVPATPPAGQTFGTYITLPVDQLSGVARYDTLRSKPQTLALYRHSLREQFIDVGGYRLHLACAGQGHPTIVMEAGWPASSATWALVAPTMALQTQVCVYDRAGEGSSEPGARPRTPLHMVRELHMLLRRAHIAGPYLLAGHSFGGLLVRLFAATYPDDVAGMVLLDSSIFDQTGICGDFRSPREPVEGCQADVRRIGFRPGLLGRKPLAILVAGDASSEGAAAAWQRFQYRFTSLSTRHTFIVVPHTDHLIQRHQPAYVIAALAQTLAQARSQY